MCKAGYNDDMISYAIELVNELQRKGACGLGRFTGKLSERLDNEDEYRDILREGRFAKILARNGFKQIEIEYLNKGPDVKAHYNSRTVYFEITRKRENEEDEAIHQSKDGVGWISRQKPVNIIRIIKNKCKKLRENELNILVIWSDTISIGRNTIAQVVQSLRQRIDRSPETYRGMSGILFTLGMSYTNGIPKQFLLFSNDKADVRLTNGLPNKLQSMTEEDPRKLQRGHENLAAAMRKHSH
jgi:hypothetical protein